MTIHTITVLGSKQSGKTSLIDSFPGKEVPLGKSPVTLKKHQGDKYFLTEMRIEALQDLLYRDSYILKASSTILLNVNLSSNASLEAVTLFLQENYERYASKLILLGNVTPNTKQSVLSHLGSLSQTYEIPLKLANATNKQTMADILDIACHQSNVSSVLYSSSPAA